MLWVLTNGSSEHPRLLLCLSKIRASMSCLKKRDTRITPEWCLPCQSPKTMSSTLAQGDDRVHFRRPACWKITSQRGHCKQKQRHDQKHSRIMGANTIEQTCHHGRSGSRKDQSGNDAHASERDPLAQEHSQNVVPPRAQGHADTDLARPLADHISQQAVNSDGGQKHRQSSKSAHQIRRKTA